MGLFSDKCPQCGYRIRKGARFCSKCGKPGERGDTTCGACGAEVALRSSFCHKCGADLSVMQSPTIIEHRWVRDQRDFAVRVDDVDVPGLLTKGIIIEHGTRALLFQKGKYVGELQEGSFDVGGVLQKINNFNRTTPASVIIMDAGDISLDLDVEGIRTRENIPVNASLRITLQIGDPDSFFLNLFKTKKKYSIAELQESLIMELKSTVEVLAAGYAIEDLLGNPKLREALEADLQNLMQEIVSRVGMKIVMLRLVRFTSPAYEEILKKKGEQFIEEEKVKTEEKELDIRESRIKLAQRLRKTLTQERMDQFMNEQEFEEFVRQQEHELGMKQVIRDDEMEQLKERMTYNRQKEGILRRIEIQGIEDEDRRAREMDELIHQEEQTNVRQSQELERRLKSAKNDLEIDRIRIEQRRLKDEYDFLQREKEHVQDMKEALDGIKILHEMVDIDHKKKRFDHDLEMERRKAELEKIDVLSKASIEAVIASSNLPQAEMLKELEQKRIQANLNPEQLLAVVAERSPDAARALAEKYRAESTVSEERLRDMEQRIKDHKEMADRMERMQREALSQIGDVAREKVKTPGPGSQTIVTGTGGTQPFVIGAGGAAPAGKQRTCPGCGISLEPDALFCPDCGKKIKG